MKVLKIGAVWCNTCNVMRPRWREIEERNPWLETEYFEFDESDEIVSKYAIDEDVIPVFVFLNNTGEEIERMHGEISIEKIQETLDRLRA